MTWNTAVAPPPRPRRRWPIVVAAAVVVVVLIAGTLLIVWWKWDTGSSGVRATWQPAPQTLLAPSMRVQPVPGWRTTVTDLGLPIPAAGAADPTRIATNVDPYWSSPFVGNLGDRGYFLASTPGTPNPQWWLVGLDVRDGRRLFAPVPLNSTITYPPECFLNGPTAVLCLRNDADAATAWVIDAEAGTVSFTGPTDLRAYPGKLGVEQVGIYAVAGSMHKGVYGVGLRAETTWFVPGDGTVHPKYLANTDFPPPTLATQPDTNPISFKETVFSLSDGKVIAPELEENTQEQRTSVYPGGFAADIAISRTHSEIRFFDDTGKRISRRGIDGDLADTDIALPIVISKDHWTVFTPDGGKLLEEPGQPSREALIIGNRLLMRDYSDSIAVRWQQFDLHTGEKGKTCDHNMGIGYLGTDGTTVVFADGNANVGLVTRARDLTTCDTLWTLTSPVGSFRHVWRVNTTLVQLSDDGTELMSLVAPR